MNHFGIALFLAAFAIFAVTAMPAEENQFPYVAAVTAVAEGVDQYTCGGFILNARYILTEALCGDDEDVDLWRVRYGSNNFSDPDLFMESNEFVPHPHYNNPGYLANNIALIRLPAYLEISDTVQPVDLPWIFVGHTFDSYRATYVTLIDLEDPVETEIEYNKLEVLSDENCDALIDNRNDNDLCTLGYETNPMQLPCNTLPGGGLIFYIGNVIPTIIGLESRKLCSELEPSTFTRLTEYLGWIAEVTGIPPLIPAA